MVIDHTERINGIYRKQFEITEGFGLTLCEVLQFLHYIMFGITLSILLDTIFVNMQANILYKIYLTYYLEFYQYY